MAKKIDVFGKSLNTPRTMLDLSSPQPEPFGGIPSGVFAVFAVIILGISLASYIPDDDTPSGGTLTQAQSEYLEDILSELLLVENGILSWKTKRNVRELIFRKRIFPDG